MGKDTRAPGLVGSRGLWSLLDACLRMREWWRMWLISLMERSASDIKWRGDDILLLLLQTLQTEEEIESEIERRGVED